MRRERREKGCISRLFTYFIYFFAAMIVITLISETAGSNSGDTSSSTEDVEASVSDVTSTPESTPTPAPEATPAPETLQEWAEYVANSVYGSFDPKYSSLISVECEQVDSPLPAKKYGCRQHHTHSVGRSQHCRGHKVQCCIGVEIGIVAV